MLCLDVLQLACLQLSVLLLYVLICIESSCGLNKKNLFFCFLGLSQFLVSFQTHAVELYLSDPTRICDIDNAPKMFSTLHTYSCCLEG